MKMDRGGDTTERFSGRKRLFPSASDKTKKGRIKSLSAVNSRSSKGGGKEMVGCHVLYGSTQLKREVGGGGEKTKKKLKIPRKRLADDSPGAYCSSVPRKLRSAMRKRNGESISQAFLGSKRSNGVCGGLKLSEADSGKKLKLNMKQGIPDCIPSHCLHGPITKDEEEVVEALFALAGMFDRKDECKNRSQVDDTNLSPSAPPQQSEAHSQALEVIKEETSASPASRSAQDAEKSFEEIANNRFPDNSFYQVTSDIRRSKLEEQKHFFSCSTQHILQEANEVLDANNLKQDSKLDFKLGIVLPDGKSDIALGLNTRTAPQVDFQNASRRAEKHVLRPDLDSMALGSAASLRSFPAKLPPWLDAALCAMKPSSPQDGSIEKVPKVDHDQKSRKRCATHLHITHLIQGMQLPKLKDSMPSNPDQPKPCEIFNRGVLVSMKTPEQHKHFPDQIQGTVASGTRNSEKQTFNFLSLSTGAGGTEAGYIMGVKNEVRTSKSQTVPFPNSSTQQSRVMAFSLSQSYPSRAYLHQPPTSSASWQAQLQPPAYVSHSFGVSHANTNQLTKQHNEQRKQQELQHQQRLWPAHVAAPYRVTGSSTSMTQYQYHQYRGSSMVIPNYVKPGASWPQSSSFTIETLGSKPRISQHQQQAATVASSLPHSKIRKQDHLSSVFDENGGAGFQAGTSLRFQLLCSDRL